MTSTINGKEFLSKLLYRKIIQMATDIAGSFSTLAWISYMSAQTLRGLRGECDRERSSWIVERSDSFWDREKLGRVKGCCPWSNGMRGYQRKCQSDT